MISGSGPLTWPVEPGRSGLFGRHDACQPPAGARSHPPCRQVLALRLRSSLPLSTPAGFQQFRAFLTHAWNLHQVCHVDRFQQLILFEPGIFAVVWRGPGVAALPEPFIGRADACSPVFSAQTGPISQILRPRHSHSLRVGRLQPLVGHACERHSTGISADCGTGWTGIRLLRLIAGLNLPSAAESGARRLPGTAFRHNPAMPVARLDGPAIAVSVLPGGVSSIMPQAA